LTILSKLHERLGENEFRVFSDIMISVNP